MRRRKDRGQAVAELAILLPVLALIVLGALDLGRVFSVWLTLSNGTREGARLVASASTPLPDEDIEKQTLADIEEQGLPPDEVEVHVYPAPEDRTGGQPITVTARYTMSLLTTYIFGGKPIPISARTSMVILPGGS